MADQIGQNVRRLVPRLPNENCVSGPPAGQNGGGVSGPPAEQNSGGGSVSGPPAAQNGGGSVSGPPAAQNGGGSGSGPPKGQNGGGSVSGPPMGQNGGGASGSSAGQTAAEAIMEAKRLRDALLQAKREVEALRQAKRDEIALLQAKRDAKLERRRETRAAARAARAAQAKPVSTPIHLTSLTKPSPAASHTQMPPTSIPVEINHKKVKKEAILNSPLPMILISRILKGIPQSPHFLQLRCYSGTARRNLEAAWDRTFEEAVEQIHELRASDFWAMARKLWKTMEELQSLGYNVFVPRKRVVELTDAMVKQNKRQNEIMVLKARAELHRMEKSRLESMILNLKAQARNAQDKMVGSLIDAADKEKDLPEIENQIVDLASQPLKKRKLA